MYDIKSLFYQMKPVIVSYSAVRDFANLTKMFYYKALMTGYKYITSAEQEI